MEKLILLSCFLFCSSVVLGQDVLTFSKSFEDYIIVDCLEQSAGEYVCLVNRRYESCTGIAILDSLGNEERYFDLGCVDYIAGGANRYHNSLVRIDQNRFYAKWGRMEDEEEVNHSIWISRFHIDGTVELLSNLSAHNWNEGAKDFLVLEDESIVLAGGNGELGGPSTGLVRKVDSTGEIIWDWSRGAFNDNFSTLMGIDLLPNGDFIVAGQAYRDDVMGYNSYVARLDNGGNLIWENVIGAMSSANGCRPFIRDQNILIMKTNGYSGFDIYWMDMDGNILSEVELNNIEGVGINGHSNLVFEEDKIHFVDAEAINGGWSKSYLYTVTGTEEITRKVVIPGPDFEQTFLYQITPTSDGGFFMCGMLEGVIQQGWAVKTDADGNTCFPPGCSTYEMVEPEDTLSSSSTSLKAFDIKTYPNPIVAEVSIDFPRPLYTRFAYLTVLNQQGILVYEQKLEAWESNWRIDLSDLSAGMYFYAIRTQEEKLATGKWFKK